MSNKIYQGFVKLTDYKPFPALLLETKPLKMQMTTIGDSP